jgi:signal transduction histidine kinase
VELRRLDELKDEFLANTSHELRTPLNGIIGLADSLIDGVAGPLPPEVEKNLSMIVASGSRLANLINDILDFSKLKNKDLVLNRKAVDVHELVDVVVSLSRPLIKSGSVTLVNDVPKDAPFVYADENRLYQILTNLLGNAVKFTERGAITVSAEKRGRDWMNGSGGHGHGHS